MDQLVATQVKPSAPSDIQEKPAKSDHVELPVGGMNCTHCPPTIEKALKSLPGVGSAHVNLADGMAHVDFDPTQTKVGDLLRAIRSVGYAAGTAKMRIPIKSMHCTTCVTRIELALQMTPGVVSARASLGTNAVDVEYQPEKTSFDAIRRAIESAGHGWPNPSRRRSRVASQSSPKRRRVRKSTAR